MIIWKFLHILSMFSAVTLLVGGVLFFEAIAHTRDARAIRRFAKALKPLENLGVGLWLAGVAFGLVTVRVSGFNFTARWLLVAYVMAAVIFLLGPIESMMQAKIARAAEASPSEAASGQLLLLINDRRRLILNLITTLLYVGIIFDMVVKPF